jgi:septation ring formation regulator EzrA
MKDFKDVERGIRLCEKEIDTLADQLSQKELALRLEVDRLRLGLEAIRRYLAEREPGFPEAYRTLKRRIVQEVDDEQDQDA